MKFKKQYQITNPFVLIPIILIVIVGVVDWCYKQLVKERFWNYPE